MGDHEGPEKDPTNCPRQTLNQRDNEPAEPLLPTMSLPGRQLEQKELHLISVCLHYPDEADWVLVTSSEGDRQEAFTRDGRAKDPCTRVG